MARRECPSCGLEVDGPRESCPSCLATLVDDADATTTCPQCGRVCPVRMHSCPGCMALLRPDPEQIADALTEAIGNGRRLHRPAGREPFAGGPSCSVLRLVANGALVVCGGDGLIEASLTGRGLRAEVPLTCVTGGRTLFRLRTYEAAARAVVAVGADGAALATYLSRGTLLDPALDVRDEASAPVARFERDPGRGGFRLVETDGTLLATGSTRDTELDDWIDDEWALTTTGAQLPLKPLAVVALAVAAKVFFGRPTPERVPEEQRRRRRREQEEEQVTLTDLLFGRFD